MEVNGRTIEPGANLKRANLEGMNLEGAYLKGANLKRANLKRANRKRANLGWRVVDFVREMQPGPGSDNTAVLTVESKVIMSPWAAKRLVMALARTLRSFEETYGELEVDPAKRTLASAAATQ